MTAALCCCRRRLGLGTTTTSFTGFLRSSWGRGKPSESIAVRRGNHIGRRGDDENYKASTSSHYGVPFDCRHHRRRRPRRQRQRPVTTVPTLSLTTPLSLSTFLSTPSMPWRLSLTVSRNWSSQCRDYHVHNHRDRSHLPRKRSFWSLVRPPQEQRGRPWNGDDERRRRRRRLPLLQRRLLTTNTNRSRQSHVLRATKRRTGNSAAEHQQQEYRRLEETVRRAVRDYLYETKILVPGASLSTVTKRPSSSPNTGSGGGTATTTTVLGLSEPAHNLLALNGFEAVPVPTKNSDDDDDDDDDDSHNANILRLAEGVVATPATEPLSPQWRYGRRGRRNPPVTRVWMYARPTPLPVAATKTAPTTPTPPPIVQEDIHLYRILENQAAAVLDHAYLAAKTWYETRIERPIQTRVRRFQHNVDQVGDQIIRTVQRVRQGSTEFTSTMWQGNGNGATRPTPMAQEQSCRSMEAPDDDSRSRINDDQDTGTTEIDATLSLETPPVVNESSTACVVATGSDTLEDLLVLQIQLDVDDDANIHTVKENIVYYSDMTPSTRIVALPNYTLGHSSASTLVSVSLVVFGAMPLAYRSFKFAWDYPGWSQAIAISVLSSISYGIWTQRTSAWTNQSYVVANAMWHRLHARDDAVQYMLHEGAIDRVTRAVLAEYYQRLDFRQDDTGALYHLRVLAMGPTPTLPLQLVDPIQLAVDFGLLVERLPKKNNGRVYETQWQAATVGDLPHKLK